MNNLNSVFFMGGLLAVAAYFTRFPFCVLWAILKRR